tara:strand:+ start:487 stop:630 length:144 start_codon:yes stop_codon:yes gene_type:complete
LFTKASLPLPSSPTYLGMGEKKGSTQSKAPKKIIYINIKLYFALEIP